MKTTVKGLIKDHLIAVCKAKNAIMRGKQEAKIKKQVTKKSTEEAINALHSTFNKDSTEAIMHALSILLGMPEISNRVFTLEWFGVLVLGKNTGGAHAYDLNVPLIITKAGGGSDNRLFHNDGAITNWPFSMVDEPRIATDEEVVTCIDNLTDKQWSVIMTNTLFGSLIKDAMNADVEVLNIGEGTEKESSEEIETNGRRITMGKE